MGWTPPDLSDKTAVVAGATRGAGRGIAVALGEAGATVYCTGRSTLAGRSPMDRPETIEDTAQQVTAAGGTGIAVAVDHLDAGQVRSLAARVGALDVLVNDIWGGDALIGWGTRFWEQDPDVSWGVLETALRTHWNTAAILAPALREGGLLVEITDGDSYQFRGHVLYDFVKTSIIRMAFGFAKDLADRATAVALTPGFMRSEAMLEHFGVTAATWRDAVAKDPNFVASETPRFGGRALACLAFDPDRHRFAGRALSSWGLSDVYGFPDLDGARPHWGHHAAKHFAVRPLDDAFYDYWTPYFEPGDAGNAA